MLYNHFLKDRPSSEVHAGKRPEPSQNVQTPQLKWDGQSVITWPLQSALQYAITLQSDRTIQAMKSILALLSVALFVYSRPGSRKLLHLFISMRACCSQAAVTATQVITHRFFLFSDSDICPISAAYRWRLDLNTSNTVPTQQHSEPPDFQNTIHHHLFYIVLFFHFV